MNDIAPFAHPGPTPPGPIHDQAGGAAPRPLRHLIYSSKASTTGDAGELTDILFSARAHNAHNGITGVLVYFDRQFLQYLEGPPDVLDETVQRIRADPRHHDLVTMADGPAERRLFSKWTMGIIDLDSEAWDRLVAADWPHVPNPREVAAGAVVLRELAALHHDPEPALAAAAAHRREAVAAERVAFGLLRLQTLLLTVLILAAAGLIYDMAQ